MMRPALFMFLFMAVFLGGVVGAELSGHPMSVWAKIVLAGIDGAAVFILLRRPTS